MKDEIIITETKTFPPKFVNICNTFVSYKCSPLVDKVYVTIRMIICRIMIIGLRK